MFKDFDRIAREIKTDNPAETSQASQQEDPFAKMFQSMAGGADGENPMDDANMMNMFKGLLGGLDGAEDPKDGESGPNDS